MPEESLLYQNAVKDLENDRQKWERILALIANSPKEENKDGELLVKIIKTEHQLSSDPKAANSTLLSEFFRKLCNVSWLKTLEGIVKAYEKVAKEYILRGQPIEPKPDTVYRYWNGDGGLKAIKKSLESDRNDDYARKLGKLIQQAHRNRSNYSWKRVVDHVRKQAVWKSIPKSSISLSPRKSTFITFTKKKSELADKKASHIHSDLGLPKPQKPCFIELQYQISKNDELRIPTLPDAGYFSYFKSANPGQPHGWTAPHISDEALDYVPESQPEAVHDSPKLDRIAKPEYIRYVPS